MRASREERGTNPRFLNAEIRPSRRVKVLVRIKPPIEETSVGLREDDGVAETGWFEGCAARVGRGFHAEDGLEGKERREGAGN
jgi:hypothetical protein